MNYSPFEIFRRNLKPLMVFLTLLALLSFVVLPVVQSSLQQSAGMGGADAVVAKFNGQELTRSRVDYFTRNHQSTVRFLVELAEETIARGGVPKTPGFQYDAQSKAIERLGINQNPSIDSTIDTFKFSALAREQGFQLDDSSLNRWLESFTGGVISEREIDAILFDSTQRMMGRPQLYEQLRSHLLADVYQRRGFAALAGNSGVLLTPDEQWRNFLKLNQNATVSTYGVLVNDFIDQTNKSPSESRIREVFEEGKDRDPNPQSSEPAFHRPYAAEFEYLVGDYQDFLDAEVAKLTDEEIKDEYERRRKGGDFQIPVDTAADEMPASTDSDADDSDADDSDAGDSDADDSDADDSGAGDSEPEGTESSDAKMTEKPESPAVAEGEKAEVEEAVVKKEAATEETAAKEAEKAVEKMKEDVTDAAADAKEAVDAPEPKKVEGSPEKPRTDAPKADAPEPKPADPKPADPKPTGEDQSGHAVSSAVRLVMMQADEEAADKPGADDSASAPEKEEANETEEAVTANSAEKPANEEPETAEQETSFKPLEDVRQEIAEDLAAGAARDAMDAAVTQVNKAMRNYFSQKAIHESNLTVGQPSEEPARPKLEAMAQELNLSYESIGPHTAQSISDEPISTSFEVGSQFGRRGPSFTIMMYGFNNGQNELAPQPLFAAVRTADDQRGKIYITWKTEETEAYTPNLDQVRDEVIMAIRMEEARDLAEAEAEKIAAKVKDGEDLATLVPDSKKDNVKAGLGPFTWMNSFGMQGASIGNVKELDSVGNDFMKATFQTEVGKASVGSNNPQRVFYVVQPTKFDPPVDELQEQFKQPINRMMARMVATDVNEVLQGYYQSVDDEVGFESFTEE